MIYDFVMQQLSSMSVPVPVGVSVGMGDVTVAVGARRRGDGGRGGGVNVLRDGERRVLLDEFDVLLVSHSFPTDPLGSFSESELESVPDEDDGVCE